VVDLSLQVDMFGFAKQDRRRLADSRASYLIKGIAVLEINLELSFTPNLNALAVALPFCCCCAHHLIQVDTIIS
jgi:hypothetical protein